jgi:hypothetical protein
MIRNKKSGKVFLLVIGVFLMSFFVSALTISDVEITEVTGTSAKISWGTDVSSNAYLSYGSDKDNLETVSDAQEKKVHSFTINNLVLGTVYYFKVESGDVVDDNSGELYLFMTLPPDESAPEIFVEFPEKVAGSSYDISGSTEGRAEVSLKVNGNFVRSTVAAEGGNFVFTGVLLEGNAPNLIELSATDDAGNKGVISGTVFADVSKPVITINELPKVIPEGVLQLKADISERVTIEIFVNDESVAQLEGDKIDQEIKLTEGKNKIRIFVVDSAGWETVEELILGSDTLAPKVSFELSNGNEYYEGRAETSILGETEPGATLYLYVFSSASERNLDFNRALASVEADEEGKFSFSEVSFPPPPFSSLEVLKPREVPAGLQDVLTSPTDVLARDQRKTYKIYVIAEDSTGKTDYAERSVHVNSCSSGEFAFSIESLPEFQAPFRLTPALMEDGRETVQAVFNMTYRGGAIGTYDASRNQFSQPYQIVGNPTFTKACTRETAESDEYSLGCKLLQNRLDVQPNLDKTAFYVTSTLLRASDFIEKEDNVWDDLDKRRLKFPIKVQVNYQERLPNGAFGTPKTQVFCQELTYFVDVPVDSSDLVPDFLADEGVATLNYTINQIENVKQYLETAMLVTGVGCVGSFLTKMTTRFYRIFISNYEHYTSAFVAVGGDKKDKVCPDDVGQQELILKDTHKKWENLGEIENPDGTIRSFPQGFDIEKESLDTKCPQTASAWSLEEFFDQAYRFTCDRFLCRSVPAGWTAKATELQVKDVKQNQLQCTATANCANSLTKTENCQEFIKKSPLNNEVVYDIRNEGAITCWKDKDGTLYRSCREDVDANCNQEELSKKQLSKFVPIFRLQDIKGKPEVIAKNPGNGDNICVAVDQNCDTRCTVKTNGKYISVPEKAKGGVSYRTDTTQGSGGCFLEVAEGSSVTLRDFDGQEMKGNMLQAGYTRDCYIDDSAPEVKTYQCVCQEKEDKTAIKGTSRQALKADGNNQEEWSYRQASIYRESSGTKGTYYPPWRYYAGRDFSGAFGLDYGLDNAITDITKESTTRVDPHNQYFGAFQSMCLTTINANLNMLQSTLIGLQKCIVEAKHNEVLDAGFCKSLFSQYICGLVYKGISYLGGQCSPLSVKDITEDYSDDTGAGVAAFFGSAFKAVPGAIDSSVKEVNDDYGNAQFKEFFSAGAQGFSESICLAAFGYDFPMGMDFIRDAAYAASTKVDVIFPIASRELTTFDPIKGVAVHNYDLGGVVFPGCKIRGYRTELKCIGFAEQNKPGVDCSQQSCDCLNINAQQESLLGERTRIVEGGSSFGDVTQHQMFDLPIESPQRVSSNFRYDHVLFNVMLDPNEDPENCFEEGYRTDNGGVFYFPIRDNSPPGILQCTARPETGKFVCPEIGSLFGGGQTYFEFPFLQCFSKVREEFVDCDSPNLFILGDEIIIKPHINLGNGAACLQIKDHSGRINRPLAVLPENWNGPYNKQISLGRVTADMIGAAGYGSFVKKSTSAPGCQVPNIINPAQVSGSSDLSFRFELINGEFKLTATGAGVRQKLDANSPDEYKINAGVLELNGDDTLTAEQINKAEFFVGALNFNNVLASATPNVGNTGVCEYSLSKSSGSSASSRPISLTVELLQPNSAGNCVDSRQLVPRSSLGENRFDTVIRVQNEYLEEAFATDMKVEFDNNNYALVIEKADAVLQKKQSTLADVFAVYYTAVSLVKMDGMTLRQGEMRSILALFFERDFTGQMLEAYPSQITATPEYQKILQYMCQIDKNLNGGTNSNQKRVNDCKVVATGAKTLCETDAKYVNTHSCQDTKTRSGGKNNCVANQCSNTILQSRGISNAPDWMCCPN